MVQDRHFVFKKAQVEGFVKKEFQRYFGTAAAHRAQGERVGVLDRTDDPVAAAQLLYTDLREADRAGLDTLVVVLPAAEGIGIALRDRLAKAAAPTGNRRARSNRGG